MKISRATLSDMERDTATLRIVCWSFLFCNALKHRERVDWNSIGLHLEMLLQFTRVICARCVDNCGKWSYTGYKKITKEGVDYGQNQHKY